MASINAVIENAFRREEEFPVTRERIYLAHAGVCPLPRAAADAMRRYVSDGTADNQESPWAMAQVDACRANAAALIGAEADEIALLGPTSLGISLVANGLSWRPGDEVVYYRDDYPANVYAWRSLERKGVKPRSIVTDQPGVITWDEIEPLLNRRTRLVALASCNFLSGYRIDVDGIGRRLRERGILFSVDGIQTLGAFATPAANVDFMSADSHKWMLGPMAAGIVYVRRDVQDQLEPLLLGAWNVESPNFIAQDEIKLYAGARRYEPGALNLPGIVGMNASLELLLRTGADKIAARLLELRRLFLEGLRPLGYELLLEDYDLGGAADDTNRSAIVTLWHPERDMKALYVKLLEWKVVASYRRNREGKGFLRLSPHFYIDENDVDRVVELMR